MTTKSSADTTTVRTVAPGSRFDHDGRLLRLIIEAFVAKGFRNRGLCSRMMEQASAITREAGRDRLTLNVRLSLDDNQVIFRRLGFEVFASRADLRLDEATGCLIRRLGSLRPNPAPPLP